MKITRKLALAFLGSAMLVGACGGGGGGSQSEDYATPRDFFEDWAGVLCEDGQDCPDAPEGTVQECIDGTVGFICSQEGANCDGAFAEGVTQAQLHSCVDDSAGLACDAELPASCMFGE